jgi:hypothetical protein
MPILTPCADAGSAKNSPLTAAAAINPDLIFASPGFCCGYAIL